MRILFSILLILHVFSIESPDLNAVVTDNKGNVIKQIGAHWIQPASLSKFLLASRLTSSLKLDDMWWHGFYGTAHPKKINQLDYYLYDPIATTDEIKAHIKKLKKTGLSEITRTLRIHHLHNNHHQIGIMRQEDYECYTAYPRDYNIDQNCTKHIIKPGKTKYIETNGNTLRVKFLSRRYCPYQGDYQPSAVVNKPEYSVWVNPDEKTLEICTDNKQDVSVPLKTKFNSSQVTQLFKQLLTNEGIKTNKIVTVLDTVKKTPPMQGITSGHTIQQIIKKMVNQSNNYLAYWLTVQIDDPTPFTQYLSDGSGLSRYNWIDINEVENQYRRILQEKPWMKKFLPDETHPPLEDYHFNLSENRKLFLKTGALAQVRNLAGVIEQDGQPLYYFAISCLHPMAMEGACAGPIHDFLSPYL